jgi:hypothetical protein
MFCVYPELYYQPGICVPDEQLQKHSPQRHRGHKENLFIVNSTDGAVNKLKLRALCASVVKSLLVTGFQ